MKKIILTAALFCTPQMAQAQSGCTAYTDTTVQPQTFDQAIASIKPVAPKDEFETSDAYRARLAAAGGSGPLIISKKIEGAEYLAYNADIGAFVVKSYLFDNTNFSAWDTFYYAKVESPKASTLSNLDVTISSSEVTTGTYSAQNGFGAKATISKIARTEKAIFEVFKPGQRPGGQLIDVPKPSNPKPGLPLLSCRSSLMSFAPPTPMARRRSAIRPISR